MNWKIEILSRKARFSCEEGYPIGQLEAAFVERETVSVRQLLFSDGTRVVVKRYFFPRFSQRLRGSLRHSWLGVPKPAREFNNLLQLRAAGLPVVEPMAWATARDRLGWVRDGWLMTRFLPQAESLEARLFRAPELGTLFWARLGQTVRAMHDAGCWYRNLQARNLLLCGGTPGVPNYAWCDPAKSRWVPGALRGARASLDLWTLLCPWDEAISTQAWKALGNGYGWPGDFKAEPLLETLPPRWRTKAVLLQKRECERLAIAAAACGQTNEQPRDSAVES